MRRMWIAMGSVDERLKPEKVTRIVVPVGMAVFTWLFLLVVAGLVLRLRSITVLNLLPLLVVGLMFWPLQVFVPWRNGVTDRFRDWVERRRLALLVTVGMIVFLMLPIGTEYLGPLIGLLQLPYRSSGMFFGVAVFYRESVGPPLGQVVFRFGQWYMEVLWLYMIAIGITAVAKNLSRR